MTPKFDELKLTGNLPSPSGVGMAILRLTQSDDFTADDLAKTIQSDPALTGRIIKMSNSAQSSGVTAITSVSDAVVRLGVRAVRNVALGFSLVSAYRKGKCKAFDFSEYWSISLGRAVAAQALSVELRLIAPTEAYICGLLSGIGKLALATVHSKPYSDLLVRTGSCDELTLAAAEKEVFEIDHFEIAEALLADWQLPTPHGRAIASFSRPVEEDMVLDKVSSRLRSVLRVAVPLADLLAAEVNQLRRPWVSLQAACELIDLSPDQLQPIYDGIAHEWADWGKTLAVPTRNTLPFAELVEAASKEPQPTLPLESPTSVRDIDATSMPEEMADHDMGPLTVMAVDDDPISLKLLSAHLSKNGYNVVQASNGAEALAIALETNPHIVVSDWMMPNMDGIELTRSLRKIEIGRDMYVLLLTGREDEERIVEAFDAGVDDFVVKPFNPRVLLSRVAAGERLVRLQEKVADDKKKMEFQVAQLAVLNRKLTVTTVTDTLTKLPNRRHALKCLEQAFDRRDEEMVDELAVVMVDIDRFKQVNDRYGHDVGDEVLRQAADVFRSLLRKGDTVCRLGGEEFVVVCPGSGLFGATKIAERLREGIEQHNIRCGDYDGRVTCSFGVAERTPVMGTHEELLKAADIAVYEAKASGRNRVCVA